MNNYPDDIRSFDDDPRSPFYNSPPCNLCHQDFENCECCEDCGKMTTDCDCEDEL